MGERKGTNKYYPPDFDPAKHGSLNKYHGSHPLRERARKLSQGILVIRFEMPFNIWCDGCQNHIGMGVRYNAEKKKVGTYYTTPVYRFRMKCHLCVNYIELQTDPGNCDYVIVSGARRKEERWDPGDSAQVLPTKLPVLQSVPVPPSVPQCSQSLPVSSSLSQSIPVLPVPRCWQQDGHWDSLSCVPNLSQSPRVAPSASSGSQCPAAGTRTGAGTASAVSPVAPSAPSAHSLSQSLPVAPSAPSSSQSIPVPPVPPSALSAPLLAPGWALGQPQPRPQPVPVPPSAPSPSQSPQSVPVSPVPPNVPSPSQCPQSPQCRCPRSPGAAGAPGPGPHVPAGARRVGQGGPGARRPHADAAAGGPARLEGRLRPQQPPAQEIPGGEEDAAGGGGGGGGAAGAGRAQHPAAPRGGGGPAPGRAAQPARPRLLRGEAAAEALRDLAALLVRPRHGPSARRDPPQIGAGGGTSAQGTAGTTADPRRARHRAAESGGGRRGRGGAVPGDPRGRAGDPRGRGRPPGAPRPVPRRRLLGLGLREPLSGVLGVRTSPQRPFPSVIYIPAQLRIKSREWPVAIVACRCCAAGRCRRRKGRCPSVCPSVRGDGARVAALPARLPGAAEPAAAAGAAPLRAGGGRGAGLGGDPRHGGAGGSGHRAAGLPEPGRGAGGGRGARRGSGGSAGVRGAEIGVPADRPPHGRQPGPRGRAAPRLRPAAGGDPRGHPPAAAGEHH